MAALKDKIQDSLDELRMLVLGLQVLVGFGFRAALEPGFDRLSHGMQLVKLTSLSLLLLALALVITPGAEHQIYERGEDTPTFHRLATVFATIALFPLAAALSLDFSIAALKSSGGRTIWLMPVLVGVVALAMWYGIELIARPQGGAAPMQASGEKAPTKDKIRHVLTEARVVLPGAQALIGFQFAATLVDGFDKLPPAMQRLHLASLFAVALSTILLITPAAWHRLVERGELTERFHRFASRMVLAALVPLAAGIGGDFYVVTNKITHSPSTAALFAAIFGVVYFVLWFGIGFARRLAGRHPLGRGSPAPA